MNEKMKKYFTRETLVTGLIGLILGVAIMLIAGALINKTGIAKLKYGSDSVASVNGKSITAQTIYDNVKVSSGFNVLMNKVDNAILDDMYTLTAKEEKEAEEQTKDFLDYYKMMGYTEEEVLSSSGVSSFDELLSEVKASLKSNKYLYDYLEKKLETGAVQKYYDEHKEELESYDSEHILVRITDSVTDEQALTLANEIIEKLNSGKTFDEVVEEYGDKIIHENLGFQSKTASLEQPYLDELIALKDGEYSKTPVKTSYGYHIVHRLSTATFEDLRETIIETLSADILTEDPNLTKKAFVELRKEKGLKIYDQELDKQYQKYVDGLYKEN